MIFKNSINMALSDITRNVEGLYIRLLYDIRGIGNVGGQEVRYNISPPSGHRHCRSHLAVFGNSHSGKK